MRPLPLAAALGGACAALYGVAVRTGVGQRLDDSTLTGYGFEARIFPYYLDHGLPPLDTGLPTLVVGALVIAAVGAARRRWADLVTGLAVVALAMLVAEALGDVLPRPALDATLFGGQGNTFPSGHTTIPIALVLGGTFVAPARSRAWVVGLGGVWVAVLAAGIQSMYYHRPSDVLGSGLVAAASVLVVGAVSRRWKSGGGDGPGIVPATVLVPAAVVALVAATRTDSWTVPLVFSLVAWLDVALLWLAVRSLDRGAGAQLR